MDYLKCWEYKKCGRQPGGDRADELGVCPAATFKPTECWTVAGTMCTGEVQGSDAQEYESCLICDYYNKMQETRTKPQRSRFFLFGQYLCSQGLINMEQVIQARSLQLRHNQKIGVFAKSRGMLTDDQIQRILIIQEETLQKFGEVATELGFLTDAQVRELVIEQEDTYLFFGEALVQLGILGEAEMFNQLKTYNTEKLKKQQEQQKIRNQLTAQ
ncbi:MAG: hypothetical protein HZB31_02095 [Nitrospirae bacterium]|nr:hypothetical protein [Nitrospirota bacterium]